METSQKRKVLVSLCLVAFLVRLWGIWNVSTTDEYNEVFEALRVCSGHLNFDRWIKRLYLYVLAFQYGLYFSVGWLVGFFHSPTDFAEKIVRNMEPLFVIGRFTSVMAGTATVAVLYKIGTQFFSRRAAIVACALLTLTVFHIDLSQQAKVDALLGLLVSTSFYFILRILASDATSKRDVAYCAIFTAFAVQTKVNSVVLMLPFLVTMAFCFRNLRETANLLVRFAMFFVVGFIVANPPVLLAPMRFLQNMVGLTNVFNTPVNTVPSDVVGFLAYPVFYYQEMGPLVSLCTVLALIYCLQSFNRQRIVVLSFVAPFSLMMGALTSLVAPYYLIPIAPLLYILVGDFLNQVLSKVKMQGSGALIHSNWGQALFLCALLFVPATNVWSHVLSVSGKNTRYVARDWIEANIAPGSKILMDSGKSINSSGPPIAESREDLQRTIEDAQANIRQGKIVHEMVDSNALIYYELLVKTVPSVSYEITSTMFGLRVENLDYYLANGYQYFVISESMKEARTGRYSKATTPRLADFYGSLDTDGRLKLIKVIGPTPKNRGDRFYIYQLVG